jgi:hypothetical protein
MKHEKIGMGSRYKFAILVFGMYLFGFLRGFYWGSLPSWTNYVSYVLMFVVGFNAEKIINWILGV